MSLSLKKRGVYLVVGFVWLAFVGLSMQAYAAGGACEFVGCPDQQLTDDPTINDVGDNPLSQGADAVSENIANLKNDQAKDSEQAQTNLLKYVKTIVDYLLALLAFAVLLYFLRGWFEMVTASWDEKKYTDGIAKMKRGIIVIIGIGLSWYIISIAYHLVKISTDLKG